MQSQNAALWQSSFNFNEFKEQDAKGERATSGTRNKRESKNQMNPEPNPTFSFPLNSAKTGLNPTQQSNPGNEFPPSNKTVINFRKDCTAKGDTEPIPTHQGHKKNSFSFDDFAFTENFSSLTNSESGVFEGGPPRPKYETRESKLERFSMELKGQMTKKTMSMIDKCNTQPLFDFSMNPLFISQAVDTKYFGKIKKNSMGGLEETQKNLDSLLRFQKEKEEALSESEMVHLLGGEFEKIKEAIRAKIAQNKKKLNSSIEEFNRVNKEKIKKLMRKNENFCSRVFRRKKIS